MMKHNRISKEQHKKRHVMLHKHMDELLGDYIHHTGKWISNSTIWNVIDWSFKQTATPEDDQIRLKPVKKVSR